MDSIIIFGAKYVFLVAGFLVLLVLAKLAPRQRLKFIITLIVAGIVALILARILSRLYYNPRPFVTDNIQPLVPHGSDNGFPSEHTWFSTTLAAAVYLFNKKYGYLAFAVVVVVGVARVFAHVHSPIDIVAGIAVGITAVYATKWLLARLVPLVNKQGQATGTKQ